MLDVDWLPSPEDVAALVRTRTRDSNGREVGTFNRDTRPTSDELPELIDTVVQDIAMDIGPVPDGLQPMARRLAAIGTALLVELTFFPDQVNSDERSSYTKLKEWYDELRPRFVTAVNDANTGGDPGTVDDVPLPLFSFPPAEGRIGLGTRW